MKQWSMTLQCLTLPRLVCRWLICVSFLITTQSGWCSPSVLVSIKPIHSLVCAVMKGAGTPTLLLEGVVSPHTYALRPGDVAQLQKASLVIWVGPSYETTLQRNLSGLGQQRVLTLMDVDGLTVYANRTGGLWGGTDTCHHHNHEYDGHIWLAPHNARVIVRAVSRELGKIDPLHASLYERNADLTVQKIDELSHELMTLLKPFRKKPYILFHDSTQYFDRYFGTTAIGSVVREPDHPPSAPHLRKITLSLQEHPSLCLFSEPQFDPKLLHRLAQDTGHHVYQLDYLGTDLQADENTYFEIMRRFSNALIRGLEGRHLKAPTACP